MIQQWWNEKSNSTVLPYVPLIRLDLYQQPASFIMLGIQFVVSLLCLDLRELRQRDERIICLFVGRMM